MIWLDVAMFGTGMLAGVAITVISILLARLVTNWKQKQNQNQDDEWDPY